MTFQQEALEMLTNLLDMQKQHDEAVHNADRLENLIDNERDELLYYVELGLEAADKKKRKKDATK